MYAFLFQQKAECLSFVFTRPMANVHPMRNTWAEKHVVDSQVVTKKSISLYRTACVLWMSLIHFPKHQALVNAYWLTENHWKSPTVQHVPPYRVSSTYAQTNGLPTFKQPDLPATLRHLMRWWLFSLSLNNAPVELFTQTRSRCIIFTEFGQAQWLIT